MPIQTPHLCLRLKTSLLPTASSVYMAHKGEAPLGGLGEVLRTHCGNARIGVVFDARLPENWYDALCAILRTHKPGYCLLRLDLRGEADKSLATVERIAAFMLDSCLRRSDCLLSFGGGLIGDLTGLAAALYQRGADIIHVPTTLLAQADAALGGKTAVNLGTRRNMLGRVYQPVAIFIDPALTTTLDAPQFRSGIAEIVKTASVAGCAFPDQPAEAAFCALEAMASSINARESESLYTVIESTLRIKAALVANDPEDYKLRRLLNAGHTFAHAIEDVLLSHHTPCLHGLAVAAGLVLEADLACCLGLVEKTLPERLRALLSRFDLPLSLGETGFDADPSLLLAPMRYDKKNDADACLMALPVETGRCELTRVEYTDLEHYLRSLAAL